MAWTIKTKLIGAAFALAVIALLTVGVTFVSLLQTRARAEQWESHTITVLNRIERLESVYRAADVIGRNSILDGARSANLDSAVAETNRALAELERETADNAAQQANCALLKTAFAARFADLGATIQLSETDGLERAADVMRVSRSLEKAQTVNETFARLKQTELGILRARNDATSHTVSGLVFYGLLLVLGVIAVWAAASFATSRMLNRKNES